MSLIACKTFVFGYVTQKIKENSKISTKNQILINKKLSGNLVSSR